MSDFGKSYPVSVPSAQPQHLSVATPTGFEFSTITQMMLHVIDNYMTDDVERLVMESEDATARWKRVDELESHVLNFGTEELKAAYQGDLFLAWHNRFRKFKNLGFVEGLNNTLIKLDQGEEVFYEDERPKNPLPDLTDNNVALYMSVYMELSPSDLFDQLAETANAEFEDRTHEVYGASYRRGAQVAEAVHLMRTGKILLS